MTKKIQYSRRRTVLARLLLSETLGIIQKEINCLKFVHTVGSVRSSFSDINEPFSDAKSPRGLNMRLLMTTYILERDDPSKILN